MNKYGYLLFTDKGVDMLVPSIEPHLRGKGLSPQSPPTKVNGTCIKGHLTSTYALCWQYYKKTTNKTLCSTYMNVVYTTFSSVEQIKGKRCVWCNKLHNPLPCTFYKRILLYFTCNICICYVANNACSWFCKNILTKVQAQNDLCIILMTSYYWDIMAEHCYVTDIHPWGI